MQKPTRPAREYLAKLEKGGKIRCALLLFDWIPVYAGMTESLIIRGLALTSVLMLLSASRAD